MRSFSSHQMVLLLGDTLTLALTTVIGFSFHGTLGTAGERLLTTFLPSLAAWLLIAPHLEVFEINRAAKLGQLWRPFWAMILAAPMAAWLRSIWLNAAIMPIFVVVLGGVNSLTILVWRGVYCLSVIRSRQSYG